MEFNRPKNIQEVLRILGRVKTSATLIAGGTNVIADLRARALKPAVLIDISRLKSLSYIKEEKRRIRIGGLMSISDLAASTVLKKYAPILSDACNQLGNPLVRNRATIAGNLADASPAADTAIPLLALDATVVTARDGGKGRLIPIDRFFTGPNRTVLKKDELIKEIVFPKISPNCKMSYLKLGLRNSMAVSVVSLALVMELEGNRCKKVRVAVGAVAPTPIRAYGTEAILTGNKITPELIESCSNEVLKEVSPISDIRASAEYRREMTSVLLRRLIRQAIG
jgi:carbon-monoxide dehydrogenase medium subunit